MSLKLSAVIVRLIAGVAVLLVVGCSGNYPVKAYDGGTLPVEQVAIIKAPEDINVVSIDGKKMTSYLLENLAVDYQVLPGSHVVVFHYSGVWAAPREKAEDDRPSVDLVESALQQFEVNLEAGKIYTFYYPSPQNRIQAFEVAKTFEATLQEAGNVVAKSAKYKVTNTPQQVSVATAVNPTSSSGPAVVVGAPAVVGGAVVGGAAVVAEGGVTPGVANVPVAAGTPAVDAAKADLPRLDALKVLWGSASKEEKKEFMRWAFK